MSEAITLVLLFVCVFGGVLWAVLFGLSQQERQRSRMFEDWQAAATELGLSCTRPKDDDRRLQGSVEGVPVRADLKYEQRGRSAGFRSTLNVGWGGRIPKSLVVHSDSLLHSMARLVDSENQDQQIGDPDFDQLVELPALDAWACAALSYRAREQLSRLIRQEGEVRQGMLVFDRVWDPGQDRVWLVQMLGWLAQLAHLLSVTPDSLQQRLADNAVHDPSPGVRLQNLRFLADASTGTPAALQISVGRALLGDANPKIRLVAAQFVGAEGHQVLEALAADPELDTPLRVLAVTALGRGPMPALAALRALCSEAQPPELVCAALASVAQQGLSALADAAVACTRSVHESVRAAAASTLGSVAHPEAEPVLIGLLSDDSAEVQRASAETLGLIGSVAAVAPLLPLAEVLSRPQLRRSARGAIGRIQSRLGNVEAGRLSLADDQELAGAVDLAETAASRVGELSLAEEVASDPDAGQRPALSADRRG